MYDGLSGDENGDVSAPVATTMVNVMQASSGDSWASLSAALMMVFANAYSFPNHRSTTRFSAFLPTRLKR